MSDEITAKLIVMDTGPLITLAAADSLDYLLYPNIPVYLPDAVLFEATRDSEALGAQQILDWAQEHSDQVFTISTQAFFRYVQTTEMPHAELKREKDLGERAAIEAIHDSIHLNEDERAVLLTEDDRVLRRILVTEAELTQKMIPLTTRDFLEGMEAVQRIQSADQVYAQASDAGRFASKRQILKDQHEKARKAVQDLRARFKSFSGVAIPCSSADEHADRSDHSPGG